MLYHDKPEPPSDDKRWQSVQAEMRKHGNTPHALIETLHMVQNLFGYIDREALRYVAMSLHIPLSKAYGVAAFYHYFTLQPEGKHVCEVCVGTACHIQGAPGILSAIENQYGIKAGETTDDGNLSLRVTHCVGVCGLAPCVEIDKQSPQKVTPDDLLKSLDKVMHHD